MSTPNKYANHKPSDQQNTSGQRRVRRKKEQARKLNQDAKEEPKRDAK